MTRRSPIGTRGARAARLPPSAPAQAAWAGDGSPPQALTQPAAFFAAEGDPARFKANLKKMMESCHAFLDFARNDIVPTSQFDFGDEP